MIVRNARSPAIRTRDVPDAELCMYPCAISKDGMLDAIRLMLVKKEDGRHIDKTFEPSFIQSILPLIEAQRDKEAERLKFAQMLEGKERETQVKRKMERLNAFNILLKAAEEYCK